MAITVKQDKDGTWRAEGPTGEVLAGYDTQICALKAATAKWPDQMVMIEEDFL